MWRSCSPGGACTPITSRCGDGYSVTPRKWSGAYAGTSSRRAIVGASTKPTYGSKASGATCIGRWTPPARPSTFFSRPSRTRPQQSASWPKPWVNRTITPRVINTDGHAAYPPAIAQLKSEGTLDSGCRHRLVPYLNNVLEQDHRAIKRRVNASQGFRSFWAAWRTFAGHETLQMIRKGQACCSAAGAKDGLLHRFIVDMFGIEA